MVQIPLIELTDLYKLSKYNIIELSNVLGEKRFNNYKYTHMNSEDKLYIYISLTTHSYYKLHFI